MLLCDIPYAMLATASHRRTSCRYSKDKIRRRLFCLSPYLYHCQRCLDVKKGTLYSSFFKNRPTQPNKSIKIYITFLYKKVPCKPLILLHLF